jgi:hypothetical protein
MSTTPSAAPPFPVGDNYYPVDYFGPSRSGPNHLHMFGDGHGPSFKDILDIINPLQHIPVISTIYQDLTGDKPGAAAQMAGAALYGGPIGVIGAFINTAIENRTGESVGQYVVSAVENLFSGSSGDHGAGGKTEFAAKPATSGTKAIADGTAKETPLPAAAPAAKVLAAAKTPPAAGLVDVEAAMDAAPAPRVAVSSKPLTLKSADLPAGHPAPVAARVVADTRMMPLDRGQALHFMPVPARHAVDPVQPPMIDVPTSSTGQQSNVPITGQYRGAAAGPSAAQVKGILAKEGYADAAVPGVPAAAAKQAVNDTESWFAKAMMKNLSKYQKMNELTKTGATVPPTPAATGPAGI